MTRVPLAATAAFGLLLLTAPAKAQTTESSKEERANVTPCREYPAGDRWRLVCAPPPFPVHQESPELAGPPPVHIGLMLPEGTPIRISIDRKTRIFHVGEPVQAHVVETVYAFDEPVIPAGSVVSGRITRIGTISRLLRVRAYASGNFSPVRPYQVSFDRLILPDGRELTMTTMVSPGAAEVVHLATKENNKDETPQEHKSVAARAAVAAKQEVKDRMHQAGTAAQQAADQIRQPGRMQRLQGYLVRQSPYHRQYLTEGTRFSAALNELLDFGSTKRNPEQLALLGTVPAPDTVVHARLVLEVSSATATRGNPVIAQLTEPVYSKDHQLLLPSDSRLIGRVLEAKPARHLHRNGELRVIFEQIELPGGALQPVQGTLEGIEVDRAAHMKLDEEGGAHATDSKTRYLSTGVALLLAAAAHPDAEHGTVDQSGDPALRAGAGASGFGLAGTLIGLVSKSNAVSIIFSAYGASTSIYTNFLSRGRNVVLPKDAPLEIGLGTTHPGSSKH